ncbi:MSF1-domain-containing protein [Lepidopterella palustris CBS 459.81]|uniref:MSF1-domain-containing protein n=1 Tax=Lepidopterella palustris CBS 459.81 TaxID=1314670 RepID=A0A8E2JH75_9PEZI|nr:MSF1-domain-containing protein [Lepidopterella palustris CBS 459.81]
MVKVYTQNYHYDYPFPAVTLAYFLRYPNPYSTHVLSTDTISRHFDPLTQTLTTTRLHLKRSKLPSGVLKLLPRSLLGASATGDSQSYILERSTVDVRNGVMDTESRNLEWTGVLSVVERQMFVRPRSAERTQFAACDTSGVKHGLIAKPEQEKTDVTTTVTLHSRLGQGRWKRKKASETLPADHPEMEKIGVGEEEAPQKLGFFKSWSTASLQRSIELIGLKKARRSQPNATEGMKVVLERLREGGLVAVLEGMRKDRETVGHHAAFKTMGGRADVEQNRANIDEIGEHFDD